MVKGQSKSKVLQNHERRAIKDWPVSERPREKLIKLGPEGLSDGELLAVLLRIGATGQSAEDLGRQLMLQFDGISGIDRAHVEELLAIPGMGVAMLFLRRHLPVAGRIIPGLFEREDEPLFPLEALREALVNAFCHRDYTIVGGAVSLAIYDDRLEIWSDGTLPFNLKPEDLKRDHASRPRNPIIAQVFYLRGMIERWGRGTQKIVELCVKAGHPEPEFGEQAGSVWVRFLPSGYIAPHRVAHDLTGRQREIMQIIANHGPLPLREIMDKMAQPPASATVRDDIYHLKRLSLVNSRGHGRGAIWSIQREDNQ